MAPEFFLQHQLVLVPTPIGSEVALHGGTHQVLSGIFENCDQSRIEILVEEAKFGRKRWGQWDLPRQWMNEWSLYNEHNQSDLEWEKEIVRKMKQGKTFFLFSDAGLPAFCDPGRLLVRTCRDLGLKVTSLFFDNSTLLALALSGFVTTPHYCHGFLPREESARQASLEQFLATPQTSILLETPYRLFQLGQELKATKVREDLLFFLAMNLNTPEEKLVYGSLPQILPHFSKGEKSPFILVKSAVGGA